MIKKTKPNNTKVILDRSAADLLQAYIWPNGMPKWMKKYRRSPELMTIFYVLFLDAKIDIDNPTLTGISLGVSSFDDYINLIMCTKTRDVVSYVATEDFELDLGVLQPHIDLPVYSSTERLRKIKRGYTILVRTDKKDKTAEVQILNNGLFDVHNPETAIFDVELSRLSIYARYLKREQRVLEGYNERKR